MNPTTPLSVMTLLIISFLLYRDIKTLQGEPSSHQKLRFLASGGTILLVAIGSLYPVSLRMGALLLCLVAGDSLLLMSPCSYEKPEQSLKSALVLLLLDVFLALSTALLPVSDDFKRAILLSRANLMAALLAVFFFRAEMRRVGTLRGLFKNTAVLHNLEDCFRFLFLTAFLVVCMMALSASSIPGVAGFSLSCLVFLLLLGFYAVLYQRAVSRRLLLIPKTKEDRIKEMVKGNLRTTCVDKVGEDARMNALYKRIMDYMTEFKPYLDDSFDMATMAEKLFTNKLYLSKTVNILSGRNFRQFVNYHRVEYAVDLIKRDPRLKISEVSEMSGFHSVVSFNMAFKINMGQTPSDWMRDYVASSEYLNSRRGD